MFVFDHMLVYSTILGVLAAPRKTPALFIVKQLAGDIRNNHVFTMYREEFV